MAILATQTASSRLGIVDVRSKQSAVANCAKGGGFEMSWNYPFADVSFGNVENIHQMREAWDK